MAPKLWRQSYGAKGMHAFIDYQRSVICDHQMSSACGFLGMILIDCQEMDFIELFKRSFLGSERSGLAHFPLIIDIIQ